jgi:FHS family glucose/mannose:H+ symporter-like MFS transporter
MQRVRKVRSEPVVSKGPVRATRFPADSIGEMNRQKDGRARIFRTIGPVFFYFLPAGAATVMLGPLLPSLIHRWHIPDSQAGALFAAQFFGQLCGSWFGTRNLRASVIYGAALSAAACVAMALVSFVAAPIALFFIGLGLGLGLAAGNVIVGTAIPAARTRLIAILNISWSVGAIVCPTLIRLSSPGGVRLFFLLTAAFLAMAALFAIAIPRDLQTSSALEDKPHLPGQIATATTRVAETSRSLFPFPFLAFAAAMFLYVGVENSLGGWLPSYAIRTDPSLQAASISFCFWMAELAGRLLIGALNIRIGEPSLYRGCLALLLLAEVLLCTVAHLSPLNMVALAILSGLTLAPLYPLIVAFMLERLGNHPRLGVLFASASLGGGIMPWMTGIFSTRFHGLRAGLLIPALGACLLMILSTAITRIPRPSAKASL